MAAAFNTQSNDVAHTVEDPAAGDRPIPERGGEGCISVASLPSGPRAAARVLLAAGTETYDSGEFERLEQVPASLRMVVEALAGLGFATGTGPPGYLLDPGSEQLRDEIDRVRDSGAQVVVLYYTGHGEQPEGDHYYVLTRDSTHSPPRGLPRTAIPAAEFMRLLTRRDEHGDLRGDQPSVLIMLDCCYSGAGGMEALTTALAGIGNPRTWWIASAAPLEWAQQGRFATLLSAALREPTTGASQRFLSLDTLIQAVNDASAGEQEARWFPPATGSTGLPPFFPNLSYRPRVAGLTLDEQHWRSRLQAGETDASGFYFTGSVGRRRATEDLADWLTRGDAGALAVVTGSPGSGKSALLALAVFLTHPVHRADLLRGAEPGSLPRLAANLLPPGLSLIAVHARGLNTEQIASAVGRGLHRRDGSAGALLEDLARTGPPIGSTLVVDAVDEATDPVGLLTGLLLPLARAGLQVSVAARRHVLDPVRDVADLVIDLDTERYRDPEALVHYVRELLVAAKEPGVRTPYQPALAGDSGEVAAVVAAAIAQRATARDGVAESFLIARLLALSVRGRPTIVDVNDSRWRTELPASVGAAFDEDLTRRLGDHVQVARVLLAALAWAHGPGLPWETLWVPVARALAGADGADLGGPDEITDRDVRWLLQTAGSYIVEDVGQGGRSVFRPFHDLIAAHLRGQPEREQTSVDQATMAAWQRRRARTETAITRALLDTLPINRAPRWPNAHPYLLTYLAEHAAAAPETLEELVSDREFLAVADRITLMPLLSPTDPRMRDPARIYRRAFPLLGDNPRINLAHLDEAAAALHVTTAGSRTGMQPLYRTRLAAVRRDDSLLVLAGAVTSVALGAGEGGRPLLATASADGTVRLWDPETGAAVGRPLTGHIGAVVSLAFGTGVGGRPLLATGGGDDDKTVRLWDPETGAPMAQPLTGHTGAVDWVAFGTGVGGRQLLASASVDGMRMWDAATGVPIGQPLTGVDRPVALGKGADGRPLVACHHRRGGVRLWDPITGAPVHQQLLPGPTITRLLGRGVLRDDLKAFVASTAFGTGAGGRPLLATGGGLHDQTVWLWDPDTGAPVGQPLRGHIDRVSSVAFGTGAGGRPLLASAGGYGDRTVRVWDLSADAPDGRSLIGHTEHVWWVAFGTGAGGRPLLASASADGTVRLWDPATGASVDQPLTGHTEGVVSVAFGMGAGGRPLLASASADGTVRLWDSATGASVGEPLTVAGTVPSGARSEGATSVAFGVGASGRPLLASGSWDGTVRLWDPDNGVPVGQPLTTIGKIERLKDRLLQERSDTFVKSVAFGTGADGRPLLASGGGIIVDSGIVWLWDPATGRQVRRPLRGHTRSVSSVAFGTAPGGRPLLASGSEDGTVRLWDPDTGTPIGDPLRGHTRSVSSVAFGAGRDGQPLLASASYDRTVRLWDLVTGTPIGDPLRGHTRSVSSVAFGVGGGGRPLLATASADRTVRLWDLITGAPVATLHRRSPAQCVALAGDAVAIGDDEGIALVEIDTGNLPTIYQALRRPMLDI